MLLSKNYFSNLKGVWYFTEQFKRKGDSGIKRSLHFVNSSCDQMGLLEASNSRILCETFYSVGPILLKFDSRVFLTEVMYWEPSQYLSWQVVNQMNDSNRELVQIQKNVNEEHLSKCPFICVTQHSQLEGYHVQWQVGYCWYYQNL